MNRSDFCGTAGPADAAGGASRSQRAQAERRHGNSSSSSIQAVSGFSNEQGSVQGRAVPAIVSGALQSCRAAGIQCFRTVGGMQIMPHVVGCCCLIVRQPVLRCAIVNVGVRQWDAWARVGLLVLLPL